MSRRVRMVIFWAFLALGVGLGAPYDPKKTEDIVRIINETKVEVVLEKGEGPPEDYEIELLKVKAVGDDARALNDQSARRVSWGTRLKKLLKVS